MISRLLDVTTTPLGANGEYVGQWKEAPWATIMIMNSLADVAGELWVEGSDDGSTVIFAYRVSAAANVPAYTAVYNVTKKMRLRYKNGLAPQTSFFAALWAADTGH